MRLPWQNRTGLAKAAAIFASMIAISSGLCGANFVAFDLCGGFGESPKPAWLVGLLVFTGIGECVAILVGATGMAMVAVLALARWIHHRFFPNMQ